MPYTETDCQYEQKEAEYLLEKRLNNKLAIMEQKGYKILKKNVKIVKQRILMSAGGILPCLEPWEKCPISVRKR